MQSNRDHLGDKETDSGTCSIPMRFSMSFGAAKEQVLTTPLRQARSRPPATQLVSTAATVCAVAAAQRA